MTTECARAYLSALPAHHMDGNHTGQWCGHQPVQQGGERTEMRPLGTRLEIPPQALRHCITSIRTTDNVAKPQALASKGKPC